VNCLLSFCYGLLTKEMLAACIAVGFDPYIGLYHKPRFGRPALALDLAENSGRCSPIQRFSPW
jgi:CRISPR-associated protein Cas1